MSKKIEKLIKEDIDNNYSFEYNKEELHKQFVIKEKDNIIKLPKYKLILRYVIVLVVGLLIGSGLDVFKRGVTSNDVITPEFEEFVRENGHKITLSKQKYLIKITEKVSIHIFQSNYKNMVDSEKNYYYYIIKSSDLISNSYLILEEKIIINKNSFGILAIIYENDVDQSIRFSIEIDGEIKEFVLN